MFSNLFGNNNCHCSDCCCERGPTGPMGPAGVTGPAGPIGPKGMTGATGPAGAVGPAGKTGAEGPAGPKGDTGKTGPAGPAGATGPAGKAPDNVFASFASYAIPLTNGSRIPLDPQVSDPTGQISYNGPSNIILEPGYYLISYGVSAILRTAGYIQVTPFYNSAAHIEKGIYFKTGSDSSSAAGSIYFILYVPSQTVFNLTFNSPVTATDGEISLTVLQLRRTS